MPEVASWYSQHARQRGVLSTPAASQPIFSSVAVMGGVSAPGHARGRVTFSTCLVDVPEVGPCVDSMMGPIIPSFVHSLWSPTVEYHGCRNRGITIHSTGIALI